MINQWDQTMMAKGTQNGSEDDRIDNASISKILDKLVNEGDGDETTLGELIGAFGHRAFGPLLLVPALIALLPTGAIPGMSILTGSIILLVSAQILTGRQDVWLPGRVTGAAIPRERLEQAVERLKPWAQTLDRHTGRRLTFLVQPPAHMAIALASAGMAVLMFPLALVPFAVAIPSAIITLFSLGLMLRDGLVVALGYLLGAAALAAWMLFV